MAALATSASAESSLECRGLVGSVVESKDSIGFAIGVNITAMIQEEDASKFLYYYAGAPLSTVIDNNVRGMVSSILSEEFGVRELREKLEGDSGKTAILESTKEMEVEE